MEDPPIVICIRNNVKVYPKMYDKTNLVIEVDYDGRKKEGSKLYNWKSQQKQLQEKIIELYEELAKRIQSRGKDFPV